MQPNFTLKKIGIFLLSPALLVLSCFFTSKINAQCTWTASTVYPVPVLDQAVVTVGTNLYSFSGVSNGAIVANSYKFDGTTWTAIAALPQALEFAAAVTDGTNIYILGGAEPTLGIPQTTLYRYNVATNNYTTLASFTVGTWNQAAVFLSGKIYKFGGTDAVAATNVLEIYDIATNTWTLGAPYPQALSFVSAIAQGGFIYAGGGTGAAASNKTYRYDPLTNTWNDAAIADLPATRWGAASAFYFNGFVMAGGYVAGSVTANISTSVISWDPVSNTWSSLPNMLAERSRMNGAVLGGNFYVIGGRSVASAGFVGTNNNQRLNCIPLLPCTGTPVPGNTLSSANPVCSGTIFTLSTQTPPASGLTYQWESSPDNVTWTPILGATGSTYATPMTVSTYYRARVTCGVNTATSQSLRVLLAPVTSCYCLPTYTSGCTGFGDGIARVRLNTLDNPSGCTANPFYTYYSALPDPEVFSGGVNPIILTALTGDADQYFGVWIDLNQDGDFSDAGEFFGPSANAGNGGTTTINMNVPSTATPGTTRLRVRGGDDVAPTAGQSCGASGSGFGEAEDYDVTIVPCVPATFATQPVSLTTQCSGTATFTATANGSVPAFTWQFRVNASSPWQTVTNGGVFSGATTGTLTLTNIPGTLNGYQFRALLTGACSAVDFSNAATLTVNPLVATVTPAAATICTGSIQQLTLTNASSPSTVTFTNNTPLAIPDGTPAGVFSTIAVSGIPAGAIVTEVSVRLNISHTFVGDLEINLIAPNAGNMNLIGELDNGTGSNSTDNFVNTVISSLGTTPLSGAPAPRTGTFAADRLQGYGPSGAFQTAPNGVAWSTMTSVLNGNWVLGLSDWFNLDIGTLNNWSITFTYGAPSAGVWTASPAAPNTMFTDPAATVPYVAGTPVTSIYVRPTVSTNYSVVYSTATPCVSSPTVIPVTVVNPPSAVVNPVNAAACVGNNATFTVSAAGGPLTYQWQVSTDNGANWSNISGATSASYTVTGVTSSMNNYRYRAVISAPPCAGSTNSGAALLTVNPLPTVTLSAPDLLLAPGQSTTITASSSPAARPLNPYIWTLNGAPLAGTSNTQSVRIDGLGAYQATVTDINGCVNTSNILTIGAEASDRLWIYPNPSPGNFQVRLYYGGTVTERRIVSIFNAAGQLVMNKEFTLGDNFASPYLRMDFDLSHLAAGTYVVKVNNTHTDRIVSGLVVIQHD